MDSSLFSPRVSYFCKGFRFLLLEMVLEARIRALGELVAPGVSLLLGLSADRASKYILGTYSFRAAFYHLLHFMSLVSYQISYTLKGMDGVGRIWANAPVTEIFLLIRTHIWLCKVMYRGFTHLNI